MTETALSAKERVASRRHYRRLMFGSIAVAVVLSLSLRFLDYPLIGEAVYWLGIVGFAAAAWLSPVELFDERDNEVERRASQTTLGVIGVVLVVGASASRTLAALDIYTMPAAVWGALYGYVLVFVVFGVAYTWVSRRS
ncbi:DUF2178 domain-containing protein [Halostella litorea]|uniref:DUF2178 domain-containing protein n=1 Tax=Halostella litorea TaxID=2528831 RepID=UPI0010925955|nr:DUF2178 domain-containing protein [Halostella litorea]